MHFPPQKKRRKKKNVGHRIAGTFINLYSMETSKPFYLGQPIEIHRNEIKGGSPYGALLSIFKVHVHEIFSHILAENSSGNSSSNLFHKEITRKISSIPRKILILLPRTKFHAFPCSTRFNCRDSSFIRTTARILNSNDPINDARTMETERIPSSRELNAFLQQRLHHSVLHFLSCTVR